MNEEHTLSVGRLGVVVIRQPWVPYTHATLALRAGSAYEVASCFGYSHFLEHLVFLSRRGAAPRPVEIVEALGGELEASTGRETTFFELKIDSVELHAGLEALAHLVFDLHLDPDEFDREKGVIEHEAREDAPGDELDVAAKELLWPDDKLFDDSLGDLELIEGSSLEELIAHHRRLYVPRNALLVVAGGIDVEATAAVVERVFATHGEIAGERADYKAPQTRQRRPIVGTHDIPAPAGDDSGMLELLLSFRGWDYNTPDNLRSYMISEMLGGAQSSRLFRSLREDTPVSYSVESYVDSFLHAGCFSLRGGILRDELDHALEVICENLSELRQLGPRDDEIEMARRSLKTFFGSELYTPTQAADFAVRRHLLDLAPEWWDPEAYGRALDGCTRETLRETAGKLFRPQRAVAAIAGDDVSSLRRHIQKKLEQSLRE